MRLINTKTLQLEEVKVPTEYAILSHRWRDGEVIFQDMKNDQRFHKKGRAKIVGLCELARRERYQYVWVDTCCINKENLTELSEAINSMYKWYSEAKVCIAYLDDVGAGQKPFEGSEWFERGWTLQELIAPSIVRFYDHQWRHIGDKTDLVEQLHHVTGIPINVLQDKKNVKDCSVAQRMSWAAKRETERVEDRAYSLLGLFSVHMPMLYGSGQDAFLSLQKVIIAKYADHSIFTWVMEPDVRYSGPFALSPSAFETCGEVKNAICSEEFKLGNLGLSISLPTVPYSMNTYLCILQASIGDSWCAILLVKLPGSQQYIRTQNSKGLSRFAVKISEGCRVRQMRISLEAPDHMPDIAYGFWLRTMAPPGINTSTVQILSNAGGTDADRITLPEGRSGTAGIISIAPRNSPIVGGWSKVHWIKFGFDDDFRPMCLLANGPVNGLSPQRFNQALASPPDSEVRRQILDERWMTGSKGELPMTETGWPSRFCTLPVDGAGGLLNLAVLNIQISVRLLPDHNPVSRAERSPESRHKIWVVDIIDLGGSSPEAAHCCSQIEYVCSWTFGALFALVGCPCMLNEVHGTRMQTHGYHGCCAL